MTPPNRLGIVTLATVAAVLFITASDLIAQSGTRGGRSTPPTAASGGASTSTGSADRAADLPVGLRGYCPVCLVEMKKWIKGDARFAVDYDGKRYMFPGAEQAEMYTQNPLKYLPVLAGDDIVEFARSGERVEGNLSFGVSHKGQSYFFASAENQRMFRSNPNAYADVDLALGGECIVCRVDMNQRVPGSSDWTVIHKGIRFQFPGEEQQAAFLKSPDRYVDAVPASARHTPPGSGTRPAAAPQSTTAGSGSR